MVIAPSLLASNFGKLAAETRRAHAARADWLHLDIMDGHFVPNISFGPAVVQTLRPLTKMTFDVHLMCSKPEILIEPFVEAGADSLTVHAELGERVPSLLWKIRSMGVRAGLAVNPPTSITEAKTYLKKIDLLLVMTVNPGFGGQSFISEMLPKVEQVAAWRREEGHGYRIEVDGGIDDQTAAECARAGADTFVSGTALFGQRQLKRAVRRMRDRVQEASAQAAEARAARGEALVG